MFDFGFGELLLTAAVALVVLGPERLPQVARTAGRWVGRLQRFIADVKNELSTQAGVAEFKEARDSFVQTARRMEAEIIDIKGGLGDLGAEIAALPDAAAGMSEYRDTDERPDFPVSTGAHRPSLKMQAARRRRDRRPRHQPRPALRVRRQR